MQDRTKVETGLSPGSNIFEKSFLKLHGSPFITLHAIGSSLDHFICDLLCYWCWCIIGTSVVTLSIVFLLVLSLVAFASLLSSIGLPVLSRWFRACHHVV